MGREPRGPNSVANVILLNDLANKTSDTMPVKRSVATLSSCPAGGGRWLPTDGGGVPCLEWIVVK